jgi:hypothetical protein
LHGNPPPTPHHRRSRGFFMQSHLAAPNSVQRQSAAHFAFFYVASEINRQMATFIAAGAGPAAPQFGTTQIRLSKLQRAQPRWSVAEPRLSAAKAHPHEYEQINDAGDSNREQEERWHVTPP